MNTIEVVPTLITSLLNNINDTLNEKDKINAYKIAAITEIKSNLYILDLLKSEINTIDFKKLSIIFKYIEFNAVVCYLNSFSHSEHFLGKILNSINSWKLFTSFEENEDELTEGETLEHNVIILVSRVNGLKVIANNFELLDIAHNLNFEKRIKNLKSLMLLILKQISNSN